MKRKRFLINPHFQLSFIAWMSAIALGVIAIFYSANLIFFELYLREGRLSGLPANHVFFKFLLKQYHLMNWIFLITSIVVFLFIALLGLLLSHRVAGPLQKLQKHLERVTDSNEFKKLHFRKKDYFKEIADSYNHHIQRLTELLKK